MNLIFKTLLFGIAVFFASNRLLSQSRFVRYQTPSAASMLKHVDFPVNHYTGIPEIKVPLHVIKVDDFELPIDLNYLSTGIKVNEAASNVGLGWNIGGIGVVSRVVKGLPDDYNKDGKIGPQDDLPFTYEFQEQRYGLFWSDAASLIRSFNTGDNSFNYVREQIKNIAFDYLPCRWYVPYHDSHPDIFYFSVNGLSGKFVFDSYQNNQKIELIPYQDVKITHQLDQKGKISGFQIIDPSGNQYFFNDVEDIMDYSTDIDNGGAEELGYNLSWHLSKIITNKNKTINFTYASESLDVELKANMEYVGGFGSHSYTSDYYTPNYDFISGTWIDVRETYTYYNQRVNSIKTVAGSYTCPNIRRLSQISTDYENVVFEASFLRNDLISSNSFAINGVKIYNKITPNKLVKGYQLNYDYFRSEGIENAQYENRKPSYRRLKLNSIKEISSNGAQQLHAEFEYNEKHPLPFRLSEAQDIWGFYNGITDNTSSIPTIFVYPSNVGSERFRALPLINYTGKDAFVLPGAKRLPDEEYMLSGLLTKVKYLGGAERHYTYGMHDFRYPDHLEGGGARIERIDYYSKNKKELSRTYTYLLDDGKTSSGKVVSIPIFAFPSGTTDLHYAMRFSTPQGILTGTQGSFVGYKQVQEIISSSVDNSNNGKIVYYFDMPAVAGETNDATGLNLYKLPVVKSVYEPLQIDCSSNNSLSVPFWSINTYHYQLTADSPPFPELPIYDWARGHLQKKIVHDKDGKIISTVENKYKAYFKNPNNKPNIVYGFSHKLLSPNSGEFSAMVISLLAGHVSYSRYEYPAGVAKVLSETKTTSKLDSRDVIEKSLYEYGSHDHMNSTKEYFIDSQNDTLLTEYSYVGDYRTSGPKPLEFIELELNNRSGMLIEIAKYKLRKGVRKILSAKLNDIQLLGNVVLPSGEYEFIGGEGMTSPFIPSTINKLPGTLSWDLRYRKLLGYNKYSSKSSLLEINDKNNVLSSIIWGYNEQYPIAEFFNAEHSDVAYTNFENGEFGNWHWSGLQFSTQAFEGNSALSFPPTGGKITKSGLDPLKKYRVRMWFLNGDWTSGVGNDFDPVRSLGNWTLYESIVSGLSTYNYSNNDCIIDNLLICPVETQFSTFEYEPGIGIKSISDTRGKTDYYLYDNFGRLKSVLDLNKNMIKDFQYNYRP